ncbi:cytochrome c oxidase subunit 4 [Agromyces archimandritae]|uniref:Cytochrome c oxidase polypeptide 4 n=1 Tax=Agromyces archimandritae TaxID=2781962 RepID=A0A975FMU5_9MICO|nr:cytochrome c oxidase subunit 4 [Agromyces archimandritae]QTX04799.1 cytochrome c oxidase subunit 4 [Agromyces archimandritae]
MRANVVIFWIIAVFMAAVAVVYAVWTLAENNWTHPEWAGSLAVALSAVLCGFIAFYLGRVHRAQGAELPEDRLDANIDDGDPELGFFSPWSWWPIALAGAAALLMLGLAVGVWIAFIGAVLGIICLVGWVYEYYRGNFAR